MGMLMLVIFIVLFVVYYQKKVLTQQNNFQKQLLSASIEVEEKERERIARNLHDDIGILLTGVKQNLNKASLNATDAELENKLKIENLNLLEDATQRVRDIAKDLVPPTLLKFRYVSALNELAKQINRSGNAQVKITEGNLNPGLSDKAELQLYRATQEIITNIIKHAEATEMEIGFFKQSACFTVKISHNGKGISNRDVVELSQEQKGIGLKSIQSRAQLINAKVNYFANNHLKKSSIEIEVPYDKKN